MGASKRQGFCDKSPQAAGGKEWGAYHGARSSTANEVQFTVNVTQLIPRLTRRSEEGDDDTVGVLELRKWGVS